MRALLLLEKHAGRAILPQQARERDAWRAGWTRRWRAAALDRARAHGRGRYRPDGGAPRRRHLRHGSRQLQAAAANCRRTGSACSSPRPCARATSAPTAIPTRASCCRRSRCRAAWAPAAGSRSWAACAPANPRSRRPRSPTSFPRPAARATSSCSPCATPIEQHGKTLAVDEFDAIYRPAVPPGQKTTATVADPGAHRPCLERHDPAHQHAQLPLLGASPGTPTASTTTATTRAARKAIRRWSPTAACRMHLMVDAALQPRQGHAHRLHRPPRPSAVGRRPDRGARRGRRRTAS